MNKTYLLVAYIALLGCNADPVSLTGDSGSNDPPAKSVELLKPEDRLPILEHVNDIREEGIRVGLFAATQAFTRYCKQEFPEEDLSRELQTRFRTSVKRPNLNRVPDPENDASWFLGHKLILFVVKVDVLPKGNKPIFSIVGTVTKFRLPNKAEILVPKFCAISEKENSISPYKKGEWRFFNRHHTIGESWETGEVLSEPMISKYIHSLGTPQHTVDYFEQLPNSHTTTNPEDSEIVLLIKKFHGKAWAEITASEVPEPMQDVLNKYDYGDWKSM